LNTEGGGAYSDIVKYDARAGRMFRVDRSQDAAGNWNTDNVEITDGFQAIFDMEHIDVGWALFASGVAPSFVLVPLGEPLPPKPSDQFKQTFRLNMKLGKSCGGDVREMASQAKVVISAMDALHTAYEAEKGKNLGKLPVVALKGSTAVVTSGQGKSSTNYAPIFEIIAWAPRPPELTGQKASTHPPVDSLQKTGPAASAKKALATVESEF
jgi:hypothetical protein